MKIKVCDFDLVSTILSGQCFRIYSEEDGSYTCIISDRVINVKQIEDILYVKSNDMNNIEEVIRYYFDLDNSYGEMNKIISCDEVMSLCVSKCKGYKILRQNGFEMCISYIISQNNNVKRISKSIDMLCKNRGKKIIFMNKEYYLFPQYDDIKDITSEELKRYGVGFRDKYIKSAVDYVTENKEDVLSYRKLSTDECVKELIKFNGVGPKVADCIALFGMQKYDTFPVDVWVKRVMEEFYVEENLSLPKIRKFALDKWGDLAGFAQQYLFYYARELGIGR